MEFRSIKEKAMNGINPVNSSPSFGMAHRVMGDVQEYAMGLPKAKSISKFLDKFTKQSEELNTRLLDVDTSIKPFKNGGEGFVGKVFYIRGGESAEKKIATGINPDRSVASNLKRYLRAVNKFIKSEAKAQKLADKKINQDIGLKLAEQRRAAEDALSEAYDKASKNAALEKGKGVLNNRL